MKWRNLTALFGSLLLVVGMALAEKPEGKGNGNLKKKDDGGEETPYDPAIAYGTRYCSSSQLYAMNADGSNKTLLLSETGGTPAWIPGTSRLIFTHEGAGLEGTGLYEVDALDPQVSVRKIANSGEFCNFVAVNPVNPSLLAVTGDGTEFPGIRFLRVNPDGGVLEQDLDTRPWDPHVGAWSPDGVRLVVKDWGWTRDIWVFDAVFDEVTGLPTRLENHQNITESMTSLGYQFSLVTDWSSRSARWLLLTGNAPDSKSDVFLVDLENETNPFFYNLTNNPDMTQGYARWSPCDDRVLVEEVRSKGLRSNHKLSIFDLEFDAEGNFLGVSGSSLLPADKWDQFYRPDWKPKDDLCP